MADRKKGKYAGHHNDHLCEYTMRIKVPHLKKSYPYDVLFMA